MVGLWCYCSERGLCCGAVAVKGGCDVVVFGCMGGGLLCERMGMILKIEEDCGLHWKVRFVI